MCFPWATTLDLPSVLARGWGLWRCIERRPRWRERSGWRAGKITKRKLGRGRQWRGMEEEKLISNGAWNSRYIYLDAVRSMHLASAVIHHSSSIPFHLSFFLSFPASSFLMSCLAAALATACIAKDGRVLHLCCSRLSSIFPSHHLSASSVNVTTVTCIYTKNWISRPAEVFPVAFCLFLRDEQLLVHCCHTMNCNK